MTKFGQNRSKCKSWKAHFVLRIAQSSLQKIEAIKDFAGILAALSICTSYFLNPLIAFITNQLGSTFVIAIWQGVLFTNAFTSAAKCF